MDRPVQFGDWQEFLDQTMREWSRGEDYNVFNKMLTRRERVEFMEKAKYVHNAAWIQKYFQRCKKANSSCKNEDKACEFRLSGNKLFKQRNFHDALHKYNECIRNASWTDGGDQLALGFSNRSAVFYHLKQFSECVADIEQAFHHAYPQHLRPKLLLRQAQAYLHLAQYDSAIKTCTLGLEELADLSSAETSDKDSLMKQFSACMKQAQGKPLSQAEPKKPYIQIVHGQSPVVTQASCGLDLKCSPQKGRHLQANRSLRAGSLIIKERPYAAVLLPPFYKSHCHHCMNILHAPIPCSSCTTVAFCSESCRQSSWDQYHKTECPFMDLFHSVGVAHLALRIILCTPLEELFTYSNDDYSDPGSNPDVVPGLTSEGVYSLNYLSVYELMPHDTHMLPEDLFQYSLTASLLLHCLDHSSYLDDSLQPDARFHIGGLLLRHICQLVCNAHAITALISHEPSDSGVATEQQVRIATAIYPTTSLLNHSCEPSIIASFQGDTLMVRLVKDVEAGEEIFNCYGPHFARMDRKERQEILKSQYFFDCNCSACLSPTSNEQLSKALQCPQCSGPVLHNTNQDSAECMECSTSVNTAHLHSQELSSQTMFTEGLRLLAEENLPAAVKKFQKCIQVREAVLFRDNKLLAEVRDALSRCYAMMGLFPEAAQLLSKCLPTIKKLYGAKSVELANELQKYADVLVNAGDLDGALKTLEQAMAIMSLNYGDHCSANQEMQQLKMNIHEVMNIH